MERFSQRESVLLGYNLQRPLTATNMNSGSSNTRGKPFRNSSDVDFHDVFGGPPRRFSMQEPRPGFRVDDDDDDDDDEDEPWSGLGNKPVFGDEGASRRRLPSADFFADIFGGGASVHSTPKRQGRDFVFPASPGSSVSSPLPPKAEPFPTSSFLSQFSLPGKASNKGVEVPIFGPSLPSSSRSQHNKHKDGSPMINGIPHSISSGASLSRFSTEATIHASNEAKSPPKPDNNSNGHFHFSIYKWKSKAVPLDIPLRAKASRSKDVAAKPETNHEDDGDDDNNKARIASRKSSNKTSVGDEFSSAEKEAASAVKEDIKTANGFVEVSQVEPQKQPEVKSVHSLFYDDLEKGLGEKPKTGGDEKKSTKASSSPVVGPAKTTTKKEAKANGVQFSPSNGKSKVKGRVKDFVKMFNQESSSPKPQQGGYEFRSKSCKWNDKCGFEDDQETSKNNTTTTTTGEEVKPQTLMPKASNEDLKHSAKVHASGQDSSTTPSCGSLSDGSKATAEETDDSFHDNFQVKELTQYENGQLESAKHNQEFQDIDAKIRLWTKGKEGNIRSLLSTLQYVLWAESGWRSVPLVDIIEGSAVKRAYQKALLCLHPDKLQQKGAASHQKYLAEKVFDILQEAWNYFTSLGAV